MTIYIDADSCPQGVRDIVARAAERRGIRAVFVANRKIPINQNEMTEMVIVEKTEGAADQFIIDTAVKGDLVITRDIPLAAQLVPMGLTVINDRGDQFTEENIRERLSIRDLMKDFRDIGIMPERQSLFGAKETKQFAAAFDRELTRLLNKKGISIQP